MMTEIDTATRGTCPNNGEHYGKLCDNCGLCMRCCGCSVEQTLGDGINMAGTYKVKMKVVDSAAYREHHGESPTFRTKTVERWLNDEAEKDDLFRRWKMMGIRAELGRYMGR